VKKIDYAKEQEFSDEDLFGDESSPDEAVLKKVRRSKKSTGVRRQAAMSADEDVDDYAGGESKMVYTEMDYDPMLPPIRERFPFLPEYEEDGSPKIELIVGRRPVDEKEEVNSDDDGEDAEDATATKPKPPASPGGDESDDDGKKSRKRKTRRSSKTKSPKTPSPTKKTNNEEPENVEYEYLVKYKGRSYLHLEWKTGADLESMNKSAKGMYRRYLKKIAAGTDDDLESPDFDPSYVVPEKIVDEKDQEFQIELTDKELLKWEKEREKELAKEEGDDDDDDDDEKEEEETGDKMAVDEEEEKKEEIQPIAEEAVNGYEKKGKWRGMSDASAHFPFFLSDG
jgi:chromodomain-helicase-DNA-binding protein 7